MVVAEPETATEFKAQPLQSLRRSASFMRRCAEPKSVHKINAQSARMRTAPQLLRMPRPNALARLQQCVCAPLLRAGPLGRLQQRDCARSLRATKATGLRACLGRTQGGTRSGGLRRVQRCVGVSKWWPGRVLACFARRARLNMVLGFQHGQPQCQ